MAYHFPNSLQPYFEPFEQNPAVHFHQWVFYSNLVTFIKQNQVETIPDVQAELMAFQFLENGTGKPSVWKTYYQPSLYREEGDQVFQIPDINLIDTELLDYWSARAQNSNHPILKARYSGLVCDFHMRTTGQRAPFEIVKVCTENLITIYRDNLTDSAIAGRFRIERALNFAIADNQKTIKAEIKELLLANDAAIQVNEVKNIWGSTFDLLVNRRPVQVNQVEEQTVISLLENRLNALVQLDPWASKAAAERLGGYYQKKGLTADVKRVMDKLGEAYDKYILTVPAIQVAAHLQELMLVYRYFQLNDEAEQLMVRIRQASKNADEEFKKIVVSGDFETEELVAYANQVLKYDGDAMFARIIQAQVMDISELKEDLDKTITAHPIRYYASNSIVDKKGRLIARLKPINESKDDHLVRHYYQTLQISAAVYLHFIFAVGIRDEKLTTPTVMDFLKKSCIIETDRHPLIESGIQAFFDGNYLICIHLLIPQFEEALRNLLEANGGNILTYSDDTYPVKTFAHVLGDPIVAKAFGDDLVYYFKMLFVDNKGWNLRNQVAHGLLEPGLFNQQTAERLMHDPLGRCACKCVILMA
jgi:hypothetical protein